MKTSRTGNGHIATGQPTAFTRREFLEMMAVGALAAGVSPAVLSAPIPTPPPFSFPWRVIGPWHIPDAPTRWWTRNGNIFTWADMLHTSPSSTLGRYVTQLGQWGFNAFAFPTEVTPDQHPDAMHNFAGYLTDRGLRFVQSRSWAETRRAGGAVAQLSDTEKLCTYHAEVRAHWTETIEQDYKTVPTIAAYHITASANSGPWMCECAECVKRTPRQRTLDAISFLADLLDKHNATLIWDACQDDPWLMRLETEFYSDLTGKIPANAIVMADDHYWDFHPGWPIHTILASAQKDAQGKSPYATNIQSPGEYRGMHEFPWPMVDEWSETFRNMARTGQQAIWVTTEILPDGWDHPLNLVNWHAISTFMRDPLADPAKIKLDWAEQQFGAKAAPAIPDILDKVREAARGMYEFDGLWTQKHSRFPWLEYLDCHVAGPYRQTKRIKGMMGLELPLDMYLPQRAAEIKSNPKTRMVFNRAEITPELKAQAMAQKDGAVQLMEQAIKQWNELKGDISAKTHAKIAAGLEANRADTIVFRNMMDIYMDWKLGVLTESKIDATLTATRGLHGAIVPEPLLGGPSESVITSGTLDARPATLARFAEQLRRDLRTPWMDKFWETHPIGVQ